VPQATALIFCPSSHIGIRMEWHRVANCGHGESTRRTSAVYAIWWWWWWWVTSKHYWRKCI